MQVIRMMVRLSRVLLVLIVMLHDPVLWKHQLSPLNIFELHYLCRDPTEIRIELKFQDTGTFDQAHQWNLLKSWLNLHTVSEGFLIAGRREVRLFLRKKEDLLTTITSPARDSHVFCSQQSFMLDNYLTSAKYPAIYNV